MTHGDKTLKVVQEARSVYIVRNISVEGDMEAFGNPPLTTGRDFLYGRLWLHVKDYPGMTFEIEHDGGECVMDEY